MDQKVKQFHEKHAFWTDASLFKAVQELDRWNDGAADYRSLELLAGQLADWTVLLDVQMKKAHETGWNQKALLFARTRLMVEELSETIYAMIAGNEIELLDGLADLVYVAHGTAVAFDLPLDEALDVVHESNMSKEVGMFKPVKGPDYIEPVMLLEQLIRKRRQAPTQLTFKFEDQENKSL